MGEKPRLEEYSRILEGKKPHLQKNSRIFRGKNPRHGKTFVGPPNLKILPPSLVLNTEGEAYGLPEKLHFLTRANVSLSPFLSLKLLK